MKKIFIVLMAVFVLFGAVRKSHAVVFTAGGAAAASFALSSKTALMASIAGHAAVIGIAGYFGGKKYLEYQAGDENGAAYNRGNAEDGTGIEGEVVNVIDLTEQDVESGVSGYTFPVDEQGAPGTITFQGTDVYLKKDSSGGADAAHAVQKGEMYYPNYSGTLIDSLSDLENAYTHVSIIQNTAAEGEDFSTVFYDIHSGTPSSSDYEFSFENSEPEEVWPEYFKPENMAEILAQEGKPGVYVGEIKDSTTKEPDKTLNITGSLGNGKFVTDTGRVIDVSGHSQVGSELEEISGGEFDDDSLSDMKYESDDGKQGVVDKDTGEQLQEDGVDKDARIKGQEGDTIYWEDSNGTEHITQTDGDTADSVRDGTPDGIRDSWGESGQRGDTEEGEDGLDIGAGDIADAPGESDVPGFDSEITDEDFSQEKQDFPFSEWRGYIPFYSAVENSGFEVSNPNPVMSMHLKLGQIDKQLTVDFSQWENILTMMGGIIYVISSFYALRFALFD